MNRPKLMRKIHKVNYGKIFSSEFKTNSIDKRLEDLELDEKLTILDNVIDYLHVNFKELSPRKPRKASGSPEKQKQLAADEGQHVEESTTDGDGVQEKTAQSVISKLKKEAAKSSQKQKEIAKKAFTQKLARFGVVPSNALNYKKTSVVLAVGGDRNRVIDRDEFKKMREANLREGPASKLLENVPPAKSERKKAAKNSFE